MNNIINLPTAAATKNRPFSVLVEWSESREFSENELIDFAAFEARALKVALTNINCGYDKTKIIVTFENGDQFAGRLDLAVGCDLGFSHYVQSSIDYYAKQEASNGDPRYLSEYKEQIDLFKTYLIDLQTVANSKTEETRATRDNEELKKEKAAQAAEAREIEKEEKAKQAAIFYENLVIPEDAKAVIVARFTEYDTEKSDPYGDYHVNKTEKTIILAWSKHTRDLFSEMRKAAKNHPDTLFLSDTENSKEHREKWSMGSGYYLTNKEYIRSGWEIKKRSISIDRPNTVPVGEMAIPSKAAPRAAKVTPVVEASEQDQPQQLDLDFKCKPIQQTTHSQKGHDLFVVQLVERTTRDQFLQLCEIAKEQGGYYSKYTKDGAINGFQFLTNVAARAFCVILGNEEKPKISAIKCGDSWEVKIEKNTITRLFTIKAESKLDAMRAAFAEFQTEHHNEPEPTPPTPPNSPKKAPQAATKSHGDKLRAQAVKMQENGEQALNCERLENTHRRADMASHARNKARKEIAHAQLLNNIATAQDNGTAGPLASIKTKAHLLTLTTVFNNAIPSEFAERSGPGSAFNTPQERIKAGAVLADFIEQITIKEYHADDLKKAGINSDEQLKASLIKYDELSGEAPQECAIKVAERALIGVKITGYFPTPEAVRAVMIEQAELLPGFTVLEPSAGGGALADDIRAAGCAVDCCEISFSLREILTAKDHNILDHDFLNVSEKIGLQYDRVIMNPPFENKQDIEHVKHAFKLLKPGGVLVSVMSAGVEHNSDSKSVSFRQWLTDNGGELQQLPANSFKTGDRSTGVNTVLITITAAEDKPGETIEEEQHEPTTRGELSLGDHDERQEARKDRAEDRAHAASLKSDQYSKKSHDLASSIPFGQPILIGHHSEKRSRRDADKIFNDMGKSVEASKKADYYSDKAASVGRAGIASDDSEAVIKLKKKIENLEKAQLLMKTINKTVKQHQDHGQQLAALIALNISEANALKLLEPDHMGRIGYASYSLSNNSAVIRSTKKRLEEIETLHNSKPIEKAGEDWRMSEEDGRICIFFDDKPGEEVRGLCKFNGFKWSRTRGAWVRKITSNATRAGEYLAQQLSELETA